MNFEPPLRRLCQLSFLACLVFAAWTGLVWFEGVAVPPAIGQSSSFWTIPYPATSKGGNASSTITSTNTFQVLFSVSNPPTLRHGCTIQNNGTHNMFISEGLGISGDSSGLPAATLTNTFILAGGVTYNCTIGGVVFFGPINITGTSGDPFYAAQY